MSEVKPLSAEQLELLRQMPCELNMENMTPLKVADLCTIANWTELPLMVRRTPAGDALLATIDQAVQEAAEGERRRIDGQFRELCEQSGNGVITVATGDHIIGIATPHPFIGPNAIAPTLTEALEAATRKSDVGDGAER